MTRHPIVLVFACAVIGCSSPPPAPPTDGAACSVANTYAVAVKQISGTCAGVPLPRRASVTGAYGEEAAVVEYSIASGVQETERTCFVTRDSFSCTDFTIECQSNEYWDSILVRTGSRTGEVTRIGVREECTSEGSFTW